jgi:hypothetical protein
MTEAVTQQVDAARPGPRAWAAPPGCVVASNPLSVSSSGSVGLLVK